MPDVELKPQVYKDPRPKEFFDPFHQRVRDHQPEAIYEVTRVITVLHTHRFGSFDPEGLAWRGGRKPLLIVSDSTNRRVYKIQRGRDRRFGTRDDIVKSFGTHQYGFTTAEDVAVRGKHLFIVSSRQTFILETTLKGGLVKKIDISGLGITSASGITFAPGTDGGRSRLYLTASGVDNNVDPNENDGRLFELRFVEIP